MKDYLCKCVRKSTGIQYVSTYFKMSLKSIDVEIIEKFPSKTATAFRQMKNNQQVK